jgi:tetratricopeptide (TPR) repeat protein
MTGWRSLHYLLLMEMNNRPAEAMDFAARLVALQRDRAPWWRMTGEIFARFNMRDSAAQALTWLLLSYYNLKQYPDCIRVCEHLFDLRVADESVYYYDSRAWAKMKEYRRSDSLLRIALKLAIRPTAEWYYDNLGNNHEGGEGGVFICEEEVGEIGM